jgi:hypothetical protein
MMPAPRARPSAARSSQSDPARGNMAAMQRSSPLGRRGGAAALAGCALALSGCGDAGAVPLRARAADVVAFELGGDGPSLAEHLRRHLPAAPVPVPVVVADPARMSDGPARLWREVPLPAGWTLSRLCAEQLGSAERWREVARLNGWTEDDVNRLSSGQLVRLPPQ